MEEIISTITMLKQKREYIIAFALFAVVAFFFLLNSPLHPWTGAVAGTDSSVFKTVALMMEKGYMPYRDSFDHKGPLLYIINWLGIRISYYRGVWIIEYIFITVTLFLMYKIARIVSGVVSSVVATFLSVSLLFQYFEGGNLAEEYAMGFIALGIYIFLEYLLNNKISVLRIVSSGFSMGAVCLLRLNMVTVWFVFCLAILIYKMKRKEWKQIGQFVLWFLVGITIIIVPVVIWLAVNHALTWCWKDYIIFNMDYISADVGRNLFSAKWKSFVTFFNTSVYIIAFIGIIYNLRNHCLINITYTLYMITNLLFICMSGRTYGHYGMVSVPAITYPISLIFQDIEHIADKATAKTLKMVLSIYALSVIILPNWMNLIKNIPDVYEQKNLSHIGDLNQTITGVIDMYASADDTISVYGNCDFIYVLSQREHATRYSYQFPIGEIMPEILEEYMEQLQEELPAIIVVQDKKLRYDENIANFLRNNDYAFVWGEYGEIENGGVLIFYRDRL